MRASAGRCAVARILAATLGSGAIAACGPPPPPQDRGPAPAPEQSSGFAAERYFPLIDGHVLSYRTETETGGKGVLTARVHRTDATQGELRYAGGKTKRFQYTPGGVLLLPDLGLVLPEPITKGAQFRGQIGGTATVLDVGVVIDVPAGSFRDCVRVVEERRGDVRTTLSTVFCPDVGVVLMEVSSGMQFERAELQSAGPPVVIQEGTDVKKEP